MTFPHVCSRIFNSDANSALKEAAREMLALGANDSDLTSVESATISDPFNTVGSSSKVARSGETDLEISREPKGKKKKQ